MENLVLRKPAKSLMYKTIKRINLMQVTLNNPFLLQMLIATIRYARWPSQMAFSVETLNYSCQYGVYFIVL